MLESILLVCLRLNLVMKALLSKCANAEARVVQRFALLTQCIVFSEVYYACIVAWVWTNSSLCRY